MKILTIITREMTFDLEVGDRENEFFSAWDTSFSEGRILGFELKGYPVRLNPYEIISMSVSEK